MLFQYTLIQQHNVATVVVIRMLNSFFTKSSFVPTTQQDCRTDGLLSLVTSVLCE